MGGGVGGANEIRVVVRLWVRGFRVSTPSPFDSVVFLGVGVIECHSFFGTKGKKGGWCVVVRKPYPSERMTTGGIGEGLTTPLSVFYHVSSAMSFTVLRSSAPTPVSTSVPSLSPPSRPDPRETCRGGGWDEQKGPETRRQRRGGPGDARDANEGK